MSNRSLEKWMREQYDRAATQYRLDDERDATGEDHQQLYLLLRSLSSKFPEPITALDIGCGTGRHFHCLENVDKLIGIDVSARMLEQAKEPVHGGNAPRQRELICANFYEYDFLPDTFNLVYSIGVFGNGCVFSVKLGSKIFRWLKPGGVLFFDAYDASDLNWTTRFRKSFRNFLHGMLPDALQQRWDRKTGWLPVFMASETKIRSLLARSGFERVTINRRLCKTPNGDAWKLQCVAVKRRTSTLTALGLAYLAAAFKSAIPCIDI